jgi:hypothetical protein
MRARKNIKKNYFFEQLQNDDNNENEREREERSGGLFIFIYSEKKISKFFIFFSLRILC